MAKIGEQITLNELDLTFNPDYERFYLHKTGKLKVIRSFAGTKTGFSNAIQIMKRYKKGEKK